MTTIELMGKEILEEMTLGILAVTFVPNYEELEEKAKTLAAEDYLKNKDSVEFAKIYNYIMNRYDIGEQDLIENFLADGYMLKIATEIESEILIAYAKESLVKLRDWFGGKEDSDEVAVYNFFDKQLV